MPLLRWACVMDAIGYLREPSFDHIYQVSNRSGIARVSPEA
jgi:hypothetical protein